MFLNLMPRSAGGVAHSAWAEALRGQGATADAAVQTNQPAGRCVDHPDDRPCRAPAAVCPDRQRSGAGAVQSSPR